jgi:hypothetical protein
MRPIILAAAVLAAIHCQAAAAPPTHNGDDLLAACRAVATGDTTASIGSLQQGICLGEIEALNWVASGQMEALRSCVPDDVSTRQMAQVVVGYLERNTGRLHEPFEGLALEALSKNWPCEEEEEKPGWLKQAIQKLFGKIDGHGTE